MGDYVPLYISLGLLVLIGLCMPLFVAPFVNAQTYDTDSFVAPLSGFLSEGVVWNVDLPLVPDFDLSFNPFGLLGHDIQTYIGETFNAFTYLPNFISLPVLLFIAFGFIYTIIKLLPTT